MKATSLSVLCLGAALSAGAAWGQLAPQMAPPKPAPLPSLPDGKVVATCSGSISITMGELRSFLGLLDQQNQQASMSDLQGYFDRLCLARKLEQMALEDKLDQNSPFKEQMVLERMQILDQAEVNKLSNPSNVDGSELEAFYASTRSKYEEVKLDAIYVAFTLSDEPQPAGEPKLLKKAEARLKIAKLLEQIQAGADFQKLAVENSDDDRSRKRNGYFETLSPADVNIPDIIRNAVFKLHTGEVTNIIEQSAGFYLFKAESVIVKPFSEVRDQVYTDLKQTRFAQLFEDMRRQNKAQVLPELLKKDDEKK